MSATSALENNEDLEHVTLVRMEDVQPERNTDVYLSNDDEIIGCVIDNLEYDNECIIDDDDSNIGSMVSIKSEEAEGIDDETSEYIVPDLMESSTEVKITGIDSAQKSWPTLEILPGGVIKDAEKYKTENDLLCSDKETTGKHEMVYACAKCPHTYKYLFCLVKHVKIHEEQKKKERPSTAILKTILKGNNDTKKVGGQTNKRKVMAQLRSKCAPKKS